jgi:alkylation response protein AidB-like acyl-CoA dehydrogenase
MDLRFSAADERFRHEVREYIASHLPGDIAQRQRQIMTLTSDTEDYLRWMRILNEQGWSVPYWEVAYGGTGWSPLQTFIFEEELHRADAPEFHRVTTSLVGPIIYLFGSEEQKSRFLPPIRRGDYIWCQGFSEPGAGSDLANLRTMAVREGDHYLVNGQKIWTSGAFEARWGVFLVRTDTTVKPQRGISFLLIDLQSDGITVRRIPQINGEAHLCEVFFKDVRVPANNLVGEPNKGWAYAKALLDHERTLSSYIHFNKREFRRAQEIARQETAEGRPLEEVPEYRTRLRQLEAQVVALEWSVLRLLTDESTRHGPTVAASILKLTGSRLQQAITQLQADMLGVRALRYFDPYHVDLEQSSFWPDYIPGRTSSALLYRASTIFGGTEQIQMNIISKATLGL